MTEPLEHLKSALAGRYALEGMIGRGGMAVVYLATDVKHDRQVALKVVHPELTPSLGRERFLREIGIAAKLTHPHILPLYDSGEAGGQLFYVMPYIEGVSLRERLDREGPLSVKAARQLAREVGSALSHAHERGIVHRDIKPGNIMLSGGHAVVTDFGVAKAVSDAGGTQLTKTGFATGTPQYMSPEQAAGEELDGRSDQYALACVLYETLAGEPPFTGPTSQAVIARHSLDPVPSLRTVRGVVPLELEAAIEQGLAKLPVDRFDSVEHFVEAVSGERAARSPGPAAEPGARKKPAWLGWTVVAVSIVIALVAVATQLDVGRFFDVDPEIERIAILDFDDAALDPELEYLSVAIPEFLTTTLTGETGGPEAIDRRRVTKAWDRAVGTSNDPMRRYAAVAADVGATHVITGQLVSQPDGLVRGQAELRRGREVLLESRPVVLPAGDAIAVAESLGVQLLAASAGEIERIAGLASSSSEAVKDWVAGNRAFRRGQWTTAIEYFSGALDRDSTFALAAWGLMLADAWYSEDAANSPVYQRGRRLAWEYRHRLPPADSAVFVAESRRNHYPVRSPGGEPEMAARYLSAVQAYPSSWLGWIRYGDYLWHEGGLYVDDGRGRAVDALRRAVELDSLGHSEPYQHLAQYYVWANDRESYSRIPETHRGGPIGDIALDLMDPAMTVAGETWRRISDSYEAPIYLLFFLQPAGAGMDEAERLAAILESRAEEGDGNSAHIAGVFALNRGRPERAERLLRIAAAEPGCIRGVCQEPEMWLQHSLFADGSAAVALQVRDSLVLALDWITSRDVASSETGSAARTGYRQLTWAAIWNLTRGEHELARRVIAIAEEAEVMDDRPLVRYNSALVRAWLAVESEAPDAAEQVATADSLFGLGVSLRHQAAYLVALAELYMRLGDSEAALNRYRREWVIMGEEPTHLLPARRLGRARMAAELGFRDEAVRAYEEYLALMSNPEPILEGLVEEVRSELAVVRRERG